MHTARELIEVLSGVDGDSIVYVPAGDGTMHALAWHELEFRHPGTGEKIVSSGTPRPV